MQVAYFLSNLDHSIGLFVAEHGTLVYAVLFAIVFCEMAFAPLFFLPGDPLLVVGGAYCASGAMNAWVLAALLFTAALAGSLVNFGIGRTIGKRVWTRDYRWIDRSALHRSHAWFEKYGAATLIVSPFVGVVRTFAPLAAGVSMMDGRRFRAFSTTGVAAWVGTLIPAGYFFGNAPLIRDHLNGLVLGGLAVGLTALAAGSLWRSVRKA